MATAIQTVTKSEVSAPRVSRATPTHYLNLNGKVCDDTGPLATTYAAFLENAFNPKTARSQMMGGIIMGLGMALLEDTVRDPRTGAIVTNNLADYRVPVNADVPPIEIGFVDHPDVTFNALGVRGVGEIGITGVAAAVANAVYHASGRRVRDLPIVPERLL